MHLHYRNLEPPVPQPAADAPPASAQAPEVPAAVAESEEAPRYDFYDILPSQELEVPESALQSHTARATLAEGSITLQAGAFKQVAEAEKLQAKLAQYGVDAKIQRLSLEDETYYRVRIGLDRDGRGVGRRTRQARRGRGGCDAGDSSGGRPAALITMP